MASYRWSQNDRTLSIIMTSNTSLSLLRATDRLVVDLEPNRLFTPLLDDAGRGRQITFLFTEVNVFFEVDKDPSLLNYDSNIFFDRVQYAVDTFKINLHSSPSAVVFRNSSSLTIAKQIEIKTARNIIIDNSIITTTDAANLSFYANMGANKTSGNFTGIDIRGGSQISTSGSGTISLNGTGGYTEMNNHGVSVS